MSDTQTTQTPSSDNRGESTLQRAISWETQDGILVIRMDAPGEKVNTISEQFGRQLGEAFQELTQNPEIKAGVLISKKPDNFIAGADIKMLKACQSAEEVEALSRQMQSQLNELAQNPKPVVAAIHGSCLGGGLEVALACHYRVCTDDPKTQLGLPEVLLGLLPGGAGTQRLPRLIGVQAALDLLLTGKSLRPRQAKKVGLVDEVLLPYGLEETAVKIARRLAESGWKRKPRTEGPGALLLEKTAPGRKLLFQKARETVLKKTGGFYPAPLAILDVVAHGLNHGFEEGLREEARRFGELVMSPEAQNLISIFLAQTALKKNRFGKPEKEIKTLGILGAGLMGSGIALVSALKNMRILLKDVSVESLANGKKQIFGELARRTKKKVLTPFERDQIMARVSGQLDYAGFSNCDVIIEAVFEDLSLKHRVLQEVEEHIREDCIFASNTSALPITEIAKVAKRPENVVGLHYFSPVHKMPLLEVITTEKTSPRAASLAVEVGLRQGKTVIVVKDGPGFYTTRILIPYFDEAVLLIKEGVGLRQLDHLMKDFGFPVGPVTLIDEVGIDVGAHVSEDMKPFFAERFGPREDNPLKEMVARGFLGRKSKKGFYLYEKPQKTLAHTLKFWEKKPEKPLNPEVFEIFGLDPKENRNFNPEEVQQRMALRFINEAVLCLQEGILASPTDGDIGAVFGLGFPPFRGGPFRYIDQVGADKIVSRMEALAEQLGKRFAPAPLLVEKARKAEKFHQE